MAHGAPDHTTMIELNPVGYVDKDTFHETKMILAGNLFNFVDFEGVGGVGATYFRTNNSGAFLQILVDGWAIFNMSPVLIHDYYGLGCQGGSNLFGCGRYDEVLNEFSLIYDPKYQVVFYKTLVVRVWNDTLNPCVIDKIHSLWKARP